MANDRMLTGASARASIYTSTGSAHLAQTTSTVTRSYRRYEPPTPSDIPFFLNKFPLSLSIAKVNFEIQKLNFPLLNYIYKHLALYCDSYFYEGVGSHSFSRYFLGN